MRSVMLAIVLGLLSAPASAAMITGATDSSKAANALKFHDLERYHEYAGALTPQDRAKDDRIAAAEKGAVRRATSTDNNQHK